MGKLIDKNVEMEIINILGNSSRYSGHEGKILSAIIANKLNFHARYEDMYSPLDIYSH